MAALFTFVAYMQFTNSMKRVRGCSKSLWTRLHISGCGMWPLQICR